MSLYFTSLNSGSNGNCYLIGNKNTAVFIDAGLSCKETEKRMRKLDLKMDNVKAIFISHEHIDHVKGLELLSLRYNLPIYLTKKTQDALRISIPQKNVTHFELNDKITIGALEIKSFPKFHDAADPSSFIVRSGKYKVGVFTDIGKVCDNVISHFKQCNAAFLEANYDEQMLENGKYPYSLKKRISGDFGHLSNDQALALFSIHRPKLMTHLLLSHLSADNNDPLLVEELFRNNSSEVNISIASRHQETEIFEIGDSTIKKAAPVIPMQLNLFENN